MLRKLITLLLAYAPELVRDYLKNRRKIAPLPASVFKGGEELPTWAKYVTIDSDGTVTAHEQMPRTELGPNKTYTYWISDGKNVDVTKTYIRPTVWKAKER